MEKHHRNRSAIHKLPCGYKTHTAPPIPKHIDPFTAFYSPAYLTPAFYAFTRHHTGVYTNMPSLGKYCSPEERRNSGGSNV